MNHPDATVLRDRARWSNVMQSRTAVDDDDNDVTNNANKDQLTQGH